MSCRILIVVSSYAPAMIADMHRARHLAWELPKLGWDVEILCPDESYQRDFCLEPNGSHFFASDTIVHSVSRLYPSLFSWLGVGSIGWRSLLPLMREGMRLLASGRFDLVYFSTTQFPLFLLGPIWFKRLFIPYILDFHDPCYKEDRLCPVWAKPNLKHKVSRWLSKKIEAFTVTSAIGLVAVSPIYIETLKHRYEYTKPKWLEAGRNAVIPFGILPEDFKDVNKAVYSQASGMDQPIRIIYVGAGGPIMRSAFLLLVRALAYLHKYNASIIKQLCIELYGTHFGWKEGDPNYLADIAKGYKLEGTIIEDCRRVSYRRSLELLVNADGALIMGVDDAGYMPSKLFNYAYSGKPLLAILRNDSPAYQQFQANPILGHALWLNAENEMPIEQASIILKSFIQEVYNRIHINRLNLLKPYMADVAARQHVNIFEACLLVKYETD